MNHIIGIFHCERQYFPSLARTEKKKEAVAKTKPTKHPELREHKGGGKVQKPLETMHYTSQVPVLAINTAQTIYAPCLLLSERWATYLASRAGVCEAKAYR